MRKFKHNYMEQGACPNCGSDDATLTHMDFGVSILLWYECPVCECNFIDAYDFATKGIVPDEEEA